MEMNNNEYQSEVSVKQKVAERLEQIQNALENISTSEDYKRYLEMMGKFHDYSLNNCILIFLQNPEATRVAGYNSWKNNFGRHVKKDEKGIEILAPTASKRHLIKKSMFDEKQLEAFLNGENVTVELKDKYSGKDYSFVTSINRYDPSDISKFLNGDSIREKDGYTYFRPVKVFDISQTEGKDLPKNPLLVNELEGKVENFDKILSAINKVSPSPVEIRPEESSSILQKGAKGYFVPLTGEIVVKAGMSDVQTLKTIIHEVAHAMLHNTQRMNKIPVHLRPDKEDKEIQAESVACAACYYFGLDTSDYSFNYVAGWASADVEKFKQSMQLINETSSEIITAIDKELFPEKYQQKELAKQQASEKRKEYAKNKAKKNKDKERKDDVER